MEITIYITLEFKWFFHIQYTGGIRGMSNMKGCKLPFKQIVKHEFESKKIRLNSIA